MPFKSDSQRKLCYLLKGKGEAGSWDCDEWSTATGKKKLPEHVEDQTEKKASSLSDVKALCALWAAPSPIKEAAAKSLLSKLSSVITSPGRGSGDIEESAVDPDPSEGMQKVKPMPARMGHKGVNKFVSPKGAARNALMRATKEVFGPDVNNRGIKSAGGPPPGNTLGGSARPPSGKGQTFNLYRPPSSNGPPAGNTLAGPSTSPKPGGTRTPMISGNILRPGDKGFGQAQPTAPKQYSPADSVVGAVQPFINAGTNLYNNSGAPGIKRNAARIGEGVAAQAGAWSNARNWLSAKGINDTVTGAAKSVGNLSGEAAGAAQGGAAIATDLGQTAGGMLKSIGNAIPGASSAFPQFSKSGRDGLLSRIRANRSGGSAPTSAPPPSINNNSAAGVTTPEPVAATPAVPPPPVVPVNENPPPTTAFQKAFGRDKQKIADLKAKGQQVSNAAGANGASGTSEGTIEQGQVQPGATFTPAAPTTPAKPVQPAVAPPKSNTSKPLFPGSPIASGVVNGVNTGVQALFDPKAHENLKQMAGRPDIPKAYKDVGEWWNRNTSGGVDKAIDYGVDAYMGKKPEGWEGALHTGKSMLLKNQIKGVKNNASTALNNTVTGVGSLANTAINAVPGARPVVNAVGAGVNDAVQGVQQGAYNGVAKFDAERQTAGYALPAVNWMNSNPWAKYLGAAALGGLGLYGINKYMGGGNKSKGTGSVLDQNFQQGLASQQPRR